MMMRRGILLLVLLVATSVCISEAANHRELWQKAQSRPKSIESFFTQGNHQVNRENSELIIVNDNIQVLIEEKSNTHRISFDQGESWTESLANQNTLRLKYANYDPVEVIGSGKDWPLKSKFKSSSSFVEDSKVTLIVQFKTRVLEAYKEMINSFGGKVLFYLPENSLVISIDKKMKESISKTAFVRWVGPYLAEYKISGSISQTFNDKISTTVSRKYNVMLLERGAEAQNQVTRMIEAIGGRVTHNLPQGFRLEVVLYTMKQVIQVAQLEQVMSVENWSEPGDDMDVVRMAGGIDYVSQVGGYNGERIRGEVLDSGLYLNHGDFVKNPPLLHGSNCPSNSHGTSVYGIVFGDGTGNSRAIGSMPRAEQGIFGCYSVLVDRYNHTQDLVDPNGKYRAVFQTNSWGDSQTTEYTSISAEMDDIIFNTDLLILQSQSNTGSTRSRPQAWSKNIFSVGAFYHFATLSNSDDTWNFGASIGFAEDGRRKPDVSNYYDEILTTASTGPAQYTTFGGTSGATPITAGHAGVLLQMWSDGVFFGNKGANNDPFDSRPHSSTSKALLINTAKQFPFDKSTTDLNRRQQGWGVVNVGTIYDAAQRGNWKLPLLVDESQPILPLQTLSFELYLPISRRKSFLKVSLVYRDPMPLVSASKQLINNLDLYVVSPTGVVYWGNNGLNDSPCSTEGGVPDDYDSVENVYICTAEDGYWTVNVYGTNIVEDTYPETSAIDAVFSLVATIGR